MTDPDPLTRPPAEAVLAGIRESPLSVDEVLAAVRHPHAGAVVVFVGHVRDHDHDRPVEVLEYSCHPSAAEVAHALAARYAAASPTETGRTETGPTETGRTETGRTETGRTETGPAGSAVVRIAVVHRVGRLEVGDLAVVAAVSAAHRAAAFEVCRALVDDFKSTVPIWKHQVFTDGADEWVGLP